LRTAGGRDKIGRVDLTVTDPERIPAARYYDPAFFALECERLWPHAWQMACRLEEIPDVGDFVEYRILDQSIVVVRVDADTVKAYFNACRHRATKLVDDRGNCEGSGFICPFHGWCWNLDGTNSFVYQPELFSEAALDPDDLRLVECQVDTWAGCVFVNMDLDAPALRATLGNLPRLLDPLNVAEMRTTWWQSTVLPANWKLAMEAFFEGYHVMQTHPQLITRHSAGADRPSEDFVELQIEGMATLGTGMGDGMILPKDVDVARTLRGIDLPADRSAAVREWHHRLNDEIYRVSHEAGVNMPDWNSVHPGNAVFFAFPHFFILPMYGNATLYRCRPLTPETCLYELWSTTLFAADDQPPPVRTTPVPIAHDDPWWPEIPGQDFSNIPRQQVGLHQQGFEFMRLSKDIEGLVSNTHRLIDGYLARLPLDRLAAAAEHVCTGIDEPIHDLGLAAGAR
jgi:phenylpropionate dioxygenase-like ring-hydroxylating dioxygenase large terminal subunit